MLADHATARGSSGYGAVILGGTPTQPRFTGRLYAARSGAQRIDRLRVAGRDARLWLAHDLPVDQPVAIFDRHVRAFGTDDQRLLGALRIGVVGAGGTGSAVIEQLARLGVRKLVMLDDDVVDDTNLTRIHGSTAADLGTPKAKLASSLATSFGTGTRARPVIGNAASREGVEVLRTCDIVFGCTDDQAGRR